MVTPNPPWARIVSQRYSSSDNLPSTWLWVLVSGARKSRLGTVRPQASGSGVNNVLMAERCRDGGVAAIVESPQPGGLVFENRDSATPRRVL